MPSPAPTTAIRYDRHGFIINGERRFLLIGTVSYYRLEREDWRARLIRLRECGFNTVDTYVPWNFHETSDGIFDFTSANRDLAAWFALCHELGLWVYLRPGPYICNEWDGGGLPAWLSLNQHLRLRQNDPHFLRHALRYLSEVNRISRPFLATKCGPIILYCIENELDFFWCNDVPAYITRLRDHVVADGIDVPLTACVGMRTPIEEATGLVDDVIPSPNVYSNGLIEMKAAAARDALVKGKFRGGQSMADLPPFVTEMNRDEMSLRRILSAGFKGLGPFNFAGGSNRGRFESTNNWGGFSLMATSIDFAGMIGFDGRIGKVFADARRLAGMIAALQETFLLGDPVTSWEGGPTCSNPALGAREADERPGRIYSLVAGDSAVVFALNDGEQAQTTTVTWNSLVCPRHSEMTIAPRYDHIIAIGIDLKPFGLAATLAYATAEVTALRTDGDEVTLVVCGEPGTFGELAFSSELAVEATSLSAEHRLVREDKTATLVVRFTEQAQTSVCSIGRRRLIVRCLARSAAGFDGIAMPAQSAPPVELGAASWRIGDLARPEFANRWTGNGKSLEELGVMHGAGWYEYVFSGSGELTFAHAGDLVGIELDGMPMATRICDGNSLTFHVPATNADHRLVMRAEIWGHANFDHDGWPSGKLGSVRGVWGPVRLDGRFIEGRWRFAAEKMPAPGGEMMAASDFSCSAGQQRIAEWTLPRAYPGGAVLVLKGENVHGQILIDGELFGRYVFGPAVPALVVGGPGDRFYLPARRLASGAKVQVTMRGIASQGGLSSLTMEELG